MWRMSWHYEWNVCVIVSRSRNTIYIYILHSSANLVLFFMYPMLIGSLLIVNLFIIHLYPCFFQPHSGIPRAWWDIQATVVDCFLSLTCMPLFCYIVSAAVVPALDVNLCCCLLFSVSPLHSACFCSTVHYHSTSTLLAFVCPLFVFSIEMCMSVVMYMM